MSKKSHKLGFAPILLLVLFAGLIAGLLLVKNPKIFRPRAGTSPIIFIVNNLPCDSNSSSCTTQSPTVKIELTSTLGRPPSESPTSQLTMQGLQNAFGSTRGDSKYDPAYDTNNDGKINLTDFNSLKRSGQLSASASTTANGTVSYKIAESPTELDSATSQPYIQEPTQLDYSFKDATPDQKFVWVEFIDSAGKTDRKSSQITLQTSQIEPSATLTVNISQTDYSQDWNYLDLTGNIRGLDSNKPYVAMVCYKGNRIGCRQSESFTTNSSGEANISNLRIVVQYVPGTNTIPEIIGIGEEPSSYSKGIPICPTLNTKSGEPCLSALFSIPQSRPASLSLTLTTKTLPSHLPLPTPITSSSPTPTKLPTPIPTPSSFYSGPAFTISSSNPSTLTCRKGVDCSYQTKLTYTNATPSFFDTYDISASSPNKVLQFSSFEGGMTSGVSRHTGTRFAPRWSNYTTVQVNIPGNLTNNLTVPTAWTAYMYFNGQCNLVTSSTCSNYQAGVWSLTINITQ